MIGWNSLNVMLTFMLTHGLYLISHGYALRQPHAVLVDPGLDVGYPLEPISMA